MTVPAPLPANETARLAALRALMVLDSEPEPAFDAIVRTASDVCGVPVALISLVDEERQWFKAQVGLPGLQQAPRALAFCAHALDGDSTLQVPDAQRDPRFARNPLVTGSPDIRFYAGAPLTLPDGLCIGTLCVIDHQPRQLTAEQQRMLRGLADIVVQTLQMRRQLIGAQGRALPLPAGHDTAERRRVGKALRESQAFLSSMGRVAGVGGWQFDLADSSLLWSEQTRRIHEVGDDEQPDLARAIEFYAPEARPVIQAAVQKAMVDGAPWDLELPLITARGRRIWVRAVGQAEFEGGSPVRLVGAFQDITQRKAVEDSLRELTEVFERTSDFVMVTDARGQVGYMNPAMRRAAGIAADEPPGRRHFAEFNTPATVALFDSTILPALRAHSVWLGETRVYLAGRREIPVSHMIIAHRDAQGKIERYSAVLRDISEEVQVKQAAASQAAALSAVIEAIPAIVAVVGSDRRYRYVNSAFERWMGSARECIVGRGVAEVLGREAHEVARPWIARVLAGETVTFEQSHSQSARSQHLAVTYIPLWLDDGSVDGFVSVRFDITQHQQQKTQLLQLAQRDPLTGLLNRTGFEEALSGCQQSQGEHGTSLALLYIDLDHFKPVNDQHGHPVGDRVLQLFGQRLLALVRPTDAVARLGGDEFAVLLVGVREAANARAVADKIIVAAHQPFEVDALQLQIGVSIGVAFGLRAEGGWTELVARADAELYRAKRAGRGRQAGC